MAVGLENTDEVEPVLTSMKTKFQPKDVFNGVMAGSSIHCSECIVEMLKGERFWNIPLNKTNLKEKTYSLDSSLTGHLHI
jgi:hypothetical protein